MTYYPGKTWVCKVAKTLKCMNQHHYRISRDPIKALQELVHAFEGVRCCTDPGYIGNLIMLEVIKQGEMHRDI